MGRAGDGHGTERVGDVIPSRSSCTKGWEEVHGENSWNGSQGTGREHPGTEKGFGMQPGGKRLQPHGIMEWETGWDSPTGTKTGEVQPCSFPSF